jgi:hypothetical protein
MWTNATMLFERFNSRDDGIQKVPKGINWCFATLCHGARWILQGLCVSVGKRRFRCVKIKMSHDRSGHFLVRY